MNRHELLTRLHELLVPRTYLEIGVNVGKSISLARCPSIGIDPFFKVMREIRCDVHLVRSSSDEFFARKYPLAHLPIPTLDLAFIDGMHLSEYALRDFINVERHTHAGSVILIDDMLPRNIEEAERDRDPWQPGIWAGDVYKVTQTLRDLRPDLVVIEVNTTPTGTILVLLPDRKNAALRTAYDAVVPAYVSPDPQDVPDTVLARTTAMDPRELLALPLWDGLRRMRVHNDDVARSTIRDMVNRLALVQERS